MAGFTFRKSLNGASEVPALLRYVGKNSVVFQVGDLVRVNQEGFVDEVDTGEAAIGVVQTVEDANGLPVTPDSGTTDTWTMASDNQTVEEKRVVVIPALPEYLFFNDADDDLATTNLLQYFDTNDENDVDVASATDTATAQVRLIELDPDGDGDASKGLFQIVESQLVGISVGSVA